MKKWAPVAVVIAALVIIGVITRAPGQGAPLDPNGTGPLGAKALVLLLRQFGADVQLVNGVPGPDTQGALVLSDQLDAARRAALTTWVAEGHRLVVADPTSDLQVAAPLQPPGLLTPAAITPAGPCPALGLDDVESVDAGTSLVLRLPAGDVGCFPAAHGFFVVSTRVGRGTVVGLGGAGVWTNSLLAHADNAALAVGLLAPNGSERVAFLTASPIGGGTTSIWKLISPNVKVALAQLLVTFLVLAWWRGRRFGRPIADPQPVVIPGAEIVTAAGDLLHRTGNREAAAHELRDGVRRWLAARLGLDPHAPPDQVAAAASAIGVDVGDLLADSPVGDADALVRLATSLSQIRTEVSGAPSR